MTQQNLSLDTSVTLVSSFQHVYLDGALLPFAIIQPSNAALLVVLINAIVWYYALRWDAKVKKEEPKKIDKEESKPR